MGNFLTKMGANPSIAPKSEETKNEKGEKCKEEIVEKSEEKIVEKIEKSE